ncbi:MAG: hypothetical protein E7K04_01660 [Helicobacter sp.]|nr:hypothetical protein [Helicobacter sp.]
MIQIRPHNLSLNVLTDLPNWREISLIFEILQNFKTFLIGGAVRDLLLNRTPLDFDFSTEAKPSQIKEAFAKRGLKTSDLGARFGTIGVFLNGKMYEITTFRKDSNYANFRHPKEVIFTENLELDVLRRDFTINALAFSPKTGLLDLINGLSDLKERKIRAIGEPKARFSEDALRILRALSFSMRFDFEIENNTKEAMFCNKNLLTHISKERITNEWLKIIAPKNAGNLESLLSEFQDILKVPFINFELKRLLKLKKEGKNVKNMSLVFLNAILLNPKNVDDLGNTAFSNAQKREILQMQELLKNKDFSKSGIKKMLFLAGKDLVLDLFNSQNDAKNLEKLEEILQNNEAFCLKQLAINGSDLDFIEPKERKNVLLSLLFQVIDNKLINNRTSLLNAIQK